MFNLIKFIIAIPVTIIMLIGTLVLNILSIPLFILEAISQNKQVSKNIQQAELEAEALRRSKQFRDEIEDKYNIDDFS